MAWLGNWKYRRKITIAGQSGAGTNYQVKLLVGESSGSGTNNFHLEGHSDDFPSGKNDSGDLRFTDNDETTLLNFWVESISGTSPNRVATIWVEVADDLGSNQDIYCYYGNAGASNVSNGNNTFQFFDDFEGASLDTDKWTEHYLEGNSGGSVAVDSSEVTVTQLSRTTTSYQIYGNQTFLNNVSLHFKGRFPDYTATTGRNRGGYVSFMESIAFNKNTINRETFEAVSSVGNRYQTKKDGTGTAIDATPSPTADHIYDLKWLSSSSVKFYYDNTYDGENTTNIPTINLPVSIIARTWDGGYSVRTIVDYIFVRKCISTEPDFSSAGSEETIPSADNSIFFGCNF